MSKLVDVNRLSPSTYNPSVVDPERLDIIELSLRKLGGVDFEFSEKRYKRIIEYEKELRE